MWYPVASVADLDDHHVFHGQLLGQELVIWRGNDGAVNVWDNRCPHRGVRLSVGTSDGRELRCAYHGWRYANRTGGCTYIPAQPGDAPAPGLAVPTFPAVQDAGMVWTTLQPDPQPFVPAEWDAAAVPVRPVPVQAPPVEVAEALATAGLGTTHIVQPVDEFTSIIRGVLEPVQASGGGLGALRRHNQVLTALRDQLEASGRVALPSAQPVLVRTAAARPKLLEVTVARKWRTGDDVVGLELRATAGSLPTMQPGAHLDVHLPNGLVRQYSLVNAPGEQDCFVLGVKREPDSRGGSAFVHEQLAEGDALTISAPRSNFVLRRDAFRIVLIAGGIGITPLLAMAQALDTGAVPYELHVFARSSAAVPFAERVSALRRSELHLGLSGTETLDRVSQLLGRHQPATYAYVCGPGPMLDGTLAVASELGWPDEAVRFEYFQNATHRDAGTSFEVQLTRSGMILQVPPGQSILEVVRDHGIEVDSSCEQGACGTCATRVLAGEPDHRDVHLTATQRARNDRMMICVSRARTPRLELDL